MDSRRPNSVPAILNNMTTEFIAIAPAVAAAGRGTAAVACRRPYPD